MKNTLDFDVNTTKYLGKHKAIEYIINSLKRLPKNYLPTKYEVNSSKNKGLFSFDRLEEFIELACKETVFGGYIKLYKIKGAFEIYINWYRNSEEFLIENPNLALNQICIYIGDGVTCIKNHAEFKIFRELWLELCLKFEAVYGQCFLHTAEQNSNNYLGWGYGKCISRLHWQTYFGKQYDQYINVDNEELKEICTIETLVDGAKVVTLNANPLEITLRTDLERRAVLLIGGEFFWNEKDNRLKLKYKYTIPKLDLSEIIYNQEE